MADKTARWYVTTGPFHDGGRQVAGPFTENNDATEARAAIERLTGKYVYWIDQHEVTTAEDDVAQEMRSMALEVIRERDDLLRHLQRIRVAYEQLHDAIYPALASLTKTRE